MLNNFTNLHKRLFQNYFSNAPCGETLLNALSYHNKHKTGFYFTRSQDYQIIHS